MRGILFVIGLACCALLHAQETLGLVPAPVELKLSDGVCQLGRPWKVAEGHAAITAILGPELAALRSGKAPMNSSEPLSISMDLIAFDTIMPPGYYALGVSPDGISISAPDEEGLFLGTRTLIQLIEKYGDKGAIPCLSINDHPRFTWRGMHLDVSRHFFPVDFIKQYIDLLARYKFNTFHWHLTDDQGWRIEIKKYPKLTSVGAWRNGSQVGPYGRREYDTLRYGGFYTQEQIRDVVAYATARHINVVPETEMPGHALAALAAYPEYSCTGGPFEVNKGWGVFPDVFCTKDSTFTFLEGILDEVLDLFPSRYIHVGGDECPHERWEACPRCQAVMQREGLKNSGELQSYFVRRIERYLNGKGRQLIGWDEILEGGLAPNAAVMSWRGTEGGIEAAKGGHPVVMTPGEFCYFDHYQGDPANEPLAIGGFTPLQKVYRFDPTAGMPDSVARFVLGGQANLWTEYILTPQQVEYMALPRMLALAEVLWTPKEKLDEKDFIRRVEGQFPQLDRSGVNASRSLYEVQFKLSPGSAPGKIKIELVPGLPGEMGYVQDQTEAVIKYTGPFEIDRSSLIKAGLYDEQGKSPRSTARMFVFNKATARKITLSTPPDERYDDGGAFTLVDGISGGERRVNTEWLGWRKSVTITVDLDSVQALTHVGIGSWHETYAWIHQPTNVVVSTSVDGKTFTPLVTIPAPADANGRTVYSADKAATARYVRFTVQHAGDIPEGFPGAGKPGWLFLDEIDVR